MSQRQLIFVLLSRMPTDDSPRMITLARQLTNAPLYSPPKVTKTYGRKLRNPRTNAFKSSGSTNQPIVLSDNDLNDHPVKASDQVTVSSSPHS